MKKIDVLEIIERLKSIYVVPTTGDWSEGFSRGWIEALTKVEMEINEM